MYILHVDVHVYNDVCRYMSLKFVTQVGFLYSFILYIVRSTGDVITVYDKQMDGWWQGEVHGRVGIFPGSYVEEIQGVRL